MVNLLRCALANSLWFLSTLPEAGRYRRALVCCEAAQHDVLQEIVSKNADTEFGRRYGFAAIRSPGEYQAAVPLAEYGEFEPYITRIAAGEQGILTAETVLLLEPTSGSAAASKLIPYTKGLKRQFQLGLAPWIADLYRNFPSLITGQSYWSITPAARKPEQTSGGIPVGFEDDSDYLGGFKGWLVRSVQAVPLEVKLIGDMESFWYVTLLFLLRSRRLALVSVWNPTFLTILCDYLHQWWPGLADDIAAGTLTVPVPLEPSLAARLVMKNRPDAARAAEIRSAFSSNKDSARSYRALWPRLRLISCWCDAAAAGPAEELERLFPQAVIQAKGLLATEGFATLPLTGHAACLPALRSHFFEFLPQGGGEVLLLHQLQAGEIYALVITTAGGLYRYCLNDLVRVEGFHHGTPLLRFIGKADGISDHFGEKLHEEHVRRALRTAAERAALQPVFAMLALDEQNPPAYALYIETPESDDDRLRRLGELLDDLLGENCQYRYCRDLGQLSPLRVFRIETNGRESYLRHCSALGQRLGDVKPQALHRLSGWTKVFTGYMLS
jgi:hypothetical protein